jgi:Fic family protein
MTFVLALLAGVLLGAALMWWVQMAAHRHGARPHTLDTDYAPAKRAVAHHLRTHGTLNLMELERMLGISGVTALRYLDQMVHDRFLKQQGHRGKGAFYTLV